MASPPPPAKTVDLLDLDMGMESGSTPPRPSPAPQPPSMPSNDLFAGLSGTPVVATKVGPITTITICYSVASHIMTFLPSSMNYHDTVYDHRPSSFTAPSFCYHRPIVLLWPRPMLHPLSPLPSPSTHLLPWKMWSLFPTHPCRHLVVVAGD